MKELKFNRIKKVLCILILVFLVVPLITVSASVSQNDNSRHVRPFPYGMPTLYQQNNSSYIGPFYPPAPYGSGNGATCGPYGCYWNGGDVSYLVASTIADNGW
jgi:hypothetical protein